MSLGCQEAFEVFKRDHADSITIEDNKQLLKQRFDEAKCLGEKLNERRNKINCLKGKIIQRQIQRAALAVSNPSEELTSDPVEENLRMQIEEEKKSYETVYSRFKGLRVEIEHLQLLMEKVKMKLQKDFEVWWSEEAKKCQQEKPEMVTSPNNATVYPQFIRPSQHLSPNSSLPEISIHQPTMNKLLQLEKQELANPAIYWKNLYTDSSDSRDSLYEDPSVKNNSTTFGNPTLKTRTPPNSGTSIPLTGDSQADADILAFIKARQNILQKKGLGNK